MEKQKHTLLGVKHFTSKKGKEYAVLQITAPFTQYETNAGSVGVKVEEKFVPDNLLDKASSLTVNKPIAFDYDVSGGRAYVLDFHQEGK